MKGKRLKNIFAGIMSTILMLTGALSGIFPCDMGPSFAANTTVEDSESSDDTAESPVIRIGTWYPDYDIHYLKAFLARRFPEYTFEFEYVDKSNYEPIMDAKLSYGGAPDILLMDQEMVEKHAITGYILNISDLCDNFTDEAKLAFGYGNAVYAIPCTSQFECIYYNKELFRKKHVRVPDTFNSFIGCCDQLWLVEGVKPLAVSLKDPYSLSNSALGVLSADYFSTDRGRGFGGRLQYGRTTFTEELLPYMDDWKALISHDVFTNDMYTIDKTTAVEKFVNEEAAMIIGGPETYNAIMRRNYKMEIGTLPYFGTTGAGKAIIGGCDIGFAINANSRNVESAIKVARSFTSFNGQLAMWKDRPGSKTYLKDVTFVNSDVYDGIQECYDKGLVFTPWMDWSFELNKPIHYQFGRELQKVLLERESLDKALENVDGMVYQILHDQ